MCLSPHFPSISIFITFCSIICLKKISTSFSSINYRENRSAPEDFLNRRSRRTKDCEKRRMLFFSFGWHYSNGRQGKQAIRDVQNPTYAHEWRRRDFQAKFDLGKSWMRGRCVIGYWNSCLENSCWSTVSENEDKEHRWWWWETLFMHKNYRQEESPFSEETDFGKTSVSWHLGKLKFIEVYQILCREMNWSGKVSRWKSKKMTRESAIHWPLLIDEDSCRHFVV